MMPINFISPNDKLNNVMGECLLEGFKRVDNKLAKFQFDTIKVMDTDGSPFLWDSFSPFTASVHDAICSFWEIGERKVTTAQIWRLLTGLKNDDAPAEGMLEAISEAVKKLMMTQVEIKILSQKEDLIISFKGAVIGCSSYTMYERGKVSVEVISMGNMPPFLEYAKHGKRLVTYPAAYLAFGVKSTEKTTLLKTIILKEIEVMKNPKSYRNTFMSIYRFYELMECGKDRKRESKVREQIFSLLEDLKKAEAIKDFSIRKSGKKTLGYTIELIKKKEVQCLNF